jgi:hypothetical protein
MALAEYSDLETTAGLASYFGVGLASGFAINLLSPDPKPEDSTAALVMQIAGSTGGGFLLLTQIMRFILPARDNWLPPCSDASAVMGMLVAQPKLRDSLAIVLSRLDDASREQLGLNVQPRIITSDAETPKPPQE